MLKSNTKVEANEAPHEEAPPKRGRKKVVKAQDGKAKEKSVVESSSYVSTRCKESGLLNTVVYPLKSNGLIDWRHIISKEHIVLNKYNLASRGISLDTLSEEDLSRLVNESPEEDLVIKLAGFRELSSIRGYTSINPEFLHISQEKVVVKVTIKWIPNVESSEPLEVGAIASASLENTDQIFSKFLETIAENRAFVRAVRHSLGIISIGQDEIKQEDMKVETQNVKLQSMLAAEMEKVGLDIVSLKQLIADSSDFIWNDKWTSTQSIDPAAAMSFIPIVKSFKAE